MESIDITLELNRGILSNTRHIKNNRTENVIRNHLIFSDIKKVVVSFSEPYLEKEDDLMTHWGDVTGEREIWAGYAMKCRVFKVKIMFEDNHVKNSFKLKGNVSKLIEYTNKMYSHLDTIKEF